MSELELESDYKKTKKDHEINKTLEISKKLASNKKSNFLISDIRDFYVMVVLISIITVVFLTIISAVKEEKENRIKEKEDFIVNLERNMRLNFIKNKECLTPGLNDIEIFPSYEKLSGSDYKDKVELLVNNTCVFTMDSSARSYFYEKVNENYKINVLYDKNIKINIKDKKTNEFINKD